MILGIKKEVFAFLQSLLTGNIICLVYNALRVFRRILKHPLFWVSCEDIIFWIWALIDAIRTTEAINRGESVEDKLF